MSPRNPNFPNFLTARDSKIFVSWQDVANAQSTNKAELYNLMDGLLESTQACYEIAKMRCDFSKGYRVRLQENLMQAVSNQIENLTKRGEIA